MKFHVPDMSCGHCTAAITKEITARDPHAKVNTDIDARTVEVATLQPEATVMGAIKAAGYQATPM